MLLDVKDLHVYYGAIQALQGISFDVKEGEIVSLIGANGAGKSTTLRAVSALIHPRRGSVTCPPTGSLARTVEPICAFSRTVRDPTGSAASIAAAGTTAGAVPAAGTPAAAVAARTAPATAGAAT